MTTSPPTVMTPAEIAALPTSRLGSIEGVWHRVIWRDERSMSGVMRVEAGHRLGGHAHRENHHHMWVLEGHATILGKELGAGSYVHIPSGVDHDIDATETDGCTLFYLYVQQAG